jgi:hypothetical protein
MKTRYLVLILLYSIFLLCGVLINKVPATNIIIGLRVYFKFIPFFLLPATYLFSSTQLKNQLILLSALLLLQAPVSFFQRTVLFPNTLSGDQVVGTLKLSGSLSIMMIAGIAILYGMLLKGRVSLKLFLAMGAIMAIPTMINETKATFVLFPLSMILITIFNKGNNSVLKIKHYFYLGIIFLVFIPSFIAVYNNLYYAHSARKGGIIEKFEDVFSGKSYLYFGAERHEDELNRKVGRLDAIELAYKNIGSEFGTFLFGYGMGNVHESFIKTNQSRFKADPKELGSEINSVASLLWELGITGLLCYAAFLILFLIDALHLRSNDDLFGNFALGWVGVTFVMIICLVYKNIVRLDNLNLLLWYFSGVVAANSCRRRQLSYRDY